MYTGLPTIEIPIHEFSIGSLRVPIKLTYYAAGNRVSDLASWVGLGWSLQTGGMITRNVLSRPDEQDLPATGLLGQPVPVPTYNPNCPTDATTEAVNNLADNQRDSQRDVFAYRTPVGSNSFILEPQTSASGKVTFLRAEPARLTYTGNLTSFLLTDPAGIRYRFTDTETTFTNPNTPNAFASYSSAWLLNEITALNTSERAVYTYAAPFNQPSAPEPLDTWVVQGELYEEQTGGSGIQTGIVSQTNRDAGLVVSTRLLQAIQFPGGKLDFILESRSGGGYNLDYIDLFSYEVGSGQYVRIKRFDLQYVSTGRLAGGSETFLTGIRLSEGDGSTVIGTYGFTYNDALPLPAAGSRKKDFWGYYNSNTGNTLID